MSSNKMNAIAYTRYGGPEVTKILPFDIPQPKSGEVQCRVTAGALNPVDKHQRAGNEFSGVVTSLGDGVTGFAVGDHVICRTTKTAMGGLGEYIAMPARLLAKAPRSISLADASGLPLAGLTAEQSLDRLDVKKGDRVLITGGAGGVGQFAIQLAKIRGAHVITTASDAGKPYVLKAGADEVIDYRTQKLAELPEKFDKVFDAAGGDEALVSDVIPAVARGGHILSVAGAITSGTFDTFVPWWKRPLVNIILGWRSSAVTSAAAAAGVNYEYLYMNPDGTQLQKLADLVDAGKLVVNIDSRFKMNDYAKAFERLESGRSKGKIIIELDSRT